ncbi:hypothetical protein DL239_18735 [Sedimentitalea sp. CY04]|uniref:Uncharacterized protein n=1 Tax=Parasedimentitalea denitrificans TaxID=2211118 RepID=A0ABX0WE34_9RHOB|nr:hypothetical protein [Sedimentitalea sp. CY04]NIZ63005.1 hypothetical protein [Sedimentitalea sp. CY04]
MGHNGNVAAGSKAAGGMVGDKQADDNPEGDILVADHQLAGAFQVDAFRVVDAQEAEYRAGVIPLGGNPADEHLLKGVSRGAGQLQAG